jgi:hypothetical protein
MASDLWIPGSATRPRNDARANAPSNLAASELNALSLGNLRAFAPLAVIGVKL